MITRLYRTTPFPHALIAPIFDAHIEGALLDLLDNVEWQRCQAAFYSFDIPASIKDRANLRDLIYSLKLLKGTTVEYFAMHFGCRMDDTYRLEIHRYIHGCGIGFHTDAAAPEVRFVMNLNRGWSQADGGIWILRSERESSNDRHYLPSLSNTGFAFSTSKSTYHALSTRGDKLMYGITLRAGRLFCGP
jgi:hypothetical protein